MKNESTLLKVREKKTEISNIFVTIGEKNACKNIKLFFKYNNNFSDNKSKNVLFLVVNGLIHL